jgi:hypothetical protein
MLSIASFKISTTNGGAIFVDLSDVFVMYTTFFECWASTDGGGVYCSGELGDVRYCCFREDESGAHGNAIRFSCEYSGQANDCSFVNCKEYDSQSAGGIYGTSQSDVSLIRLNFSDCGSSASSPGVILFWTGGPWFFARCTVLRCTGLSGLDDATSRAQHVEWSNFYNNSFAHDGCLLSALSYGFEVDGCIFSGNSVEFYMAYPSRSDGFSVMDCVFQDSLPPGNIYKATTDNQFETSPTSFSFTYFATEYCPNAPPERTPADSPQETASMAPAQSDAATPAGSPEPSASEDFNDSALLRETAFRGPSAALEESAPPDFSEDFPDTVAFNSSVADPDSAVATGSAPLAASKGLRQSQCKDHQHPRPPAIGQSFSDHSQGSFDAAHPSQSSLDGH